MKNRDKPPIQAIDKLGVFANEEARYIQTGRDLDHLRDSLEKLSSSTLGQVTRRVSSEQLEVPQNTPERTPTPKKL